MTNLNTFQRKNSKRWIGITAGCILILAVAAYFLYKPLLVYTVSHALADTDSVAPAYLGRYGKQIQKYKKPINKASEQVIHELDSLHIPFEVFLKTIDEMDKQEILKTLSEIKRLKPQTSNEVFNITKNNMTVTAFDIEIFRGAWRSASPGPQPRSAQHGTICR